MKQEHLLSIILGQSVLLIGFLIKTLWQGNKGEIKDLKDSIKENNRLTIENTLALTRLTVKIEEHDEKLDIVGELRRDMDKMGLALRAVRNSNGNPGDNSGH